MHISWLPLWCPQIIQITKREILRVKGRPRNVFQYCVYFTYTIKTIENMLSMFSAYVYFIGVLKLLQIALLKLV